ncbi:MAG: DUF3108 domain-containing protein [Betaproteobacteria bacterium]|nr:DUF3108 domain-containing protein [Betaproteobacteria bacterium]
MLDRTARTLSLCLAASAVLHLALVAQLPGFPIQLDAQETPLNAQIVELDPPVPPPLPQPVPKRAIKQAVAPKMPLAPVAPPPAAIASPAPEPIVLPGPEPIVLPSPEPAVSATPEEADPAASEMAAAESPQATAAAPESLAPIPDTEPPAAVAEAASEPPQRQTGTIRYEVYYGSDRFSIGRSVQTWSIDKSSYRLTSFSETTGLLGLFRPYHYAYVTEGRVEPDGLKPEAFTVRRGRDGERQATAHFNWASGELTFGKLGSARTAPLNASSYDLLTLFYQLPRMGLTPGQLQVSVTTGTKFNTYLLEVGAEEVLELPVGTLRTIPVRQVRRPGEESIAVWLAPEKRYLPVRIVFLDEQGDMTAEQIATQIAVGTLAADGR